MKYLEYLIIIVLILALYLTCYWYFSKLNNTQPLKITWPEEKEQLKAGVNNQKD